MVYFSKNETALALVSAEKEKTRIKKEFQEADKTCSIAPVESYESYLKCLDQKVQPEGLNIIGITSYVVSYVETQKEARHQQWFKKLKDKNLIESYLIQRFLLVNELQISNYSILQKKLKDTELEDIMSLDKANLQTAHDLIDKNFKNIERFLSKNSTDDADENQKKLYEEINSKYLEQSELYKSIFNETFYKRAIK